MKNLSVEYEEFKVIESKVIDNPLKTPPTKTLPAKSIATELAYSQFDPPAVLAQSTLPEELNFAMKKSVAFALTGLLIVIVSKVMVSPLTFPTTIKLLKESTEIALGTSDHIPPPETAQSTPPTELYLTMNTSSWPGFVLISMVEPNVIVAPAKEPATMTFPKGSVVTAIPRSVALPPADCDQRIEPAMSYLTIYISQSPELLKVVEPKVIVGLLKEPTAYIFPEESVETECATSSFKPPVEFAHSQEDVWPCIKFIILLNTRKIANFNCIVFNANRFLIITNLNLRFINSKK
nr:hypothetical protein [Bacteroidota bacterium]